MRGYKAMNEDMTCRGFQYEIGKTYTIGGEIKICEKGFHFCANLVSCFKFYNPLENEGLRFCEVESHGDTIESGREDKIVTGKITIIREISQIDVYRALYGNGYGYGYGYGDSDGDGSGDGDGYGDSYGDGDGYGDGSGYGYSSGFGSGFGYGYIYDYGNGYGFGDGSGFGSGFGSGSKKAGIFKFMEETT